MKNLPKWHETMIILLIVGQLKKLDNNVNVTVAVAD